MEKQSFMEFDFKKAIPTESSKAEEKISVLVTKKFLLIIFLFGLGIGMGNKILYQYQVNQQKEVIAEKIKQHDFFLIAQQNKDMINTFFDTQMIMYDDIVKDIVEANKKIPNSAQTILNQNNKIRNSSQDYKESILKIMSDFKKVTQSEDSFSTSTSAEKSMIEHNIKRYQIGSLNRSDVLENMLMSFTTTNVDEIDMKEKATPIRTELKKQVVEKISNLLGNNDMTKFKILKTK